MKRILKISALAFVIMLVSSPQNKTSAQYSNSDVSYQTFYDELSPYGDWIEYPEYGYVWQPRMGDDFRPYSSGGHWVWSDNYEWTWVSDYDWGWAPFHYGRWFQDDSYGWLWVPGYEWSSAWVAWRDGGDYYGWAPLRPGISININFNIGSYSPPYDYWCFAPRRYITSVNLFNHCIDRRQNVTIINQTTIINYNNYNSSYGFRSGPRRYDVERYTGRINPVRFTDSYRAGRSEFRNNEVSIYRPRVQQNDNNRFTPRQFERYDRSNNRSRNNGNNGIARNDNDFRRNDNDIRRGNTTNNRDNNLPVRRERDNNSGIERRNDNPVRQPQQNDNNNNAERRRNVFERNDNNNRQPNRNEERRISRPPERTNTNPNQNNTSDNRRFERRNDNNGNTNNPVREQRQDTRNDNNNRPQRQVLPQTEQRTRQEQPRQFERRDDGNRQQNNNGNNSFRKDRKRD